MQYLAIRGQDPRAHKMALKFTACDKNLNASRGFVGLYDMAENQDLTGVGCARATLEIMENMCVPKNDIPFSALCLLSFI